MLFVSPRSALPRARSRNRVLELTPGGAARLRRRLHRVRGAQRATRRRACAADMALQAPQACAADPALPSRPDTLPKRGAGGLEPACHDRPAAQRETAPARPRRGGGGPGAPPGRQRARGWAQHREDPVAAHPGLPAGGHRRRGGRAGSELAEKYDRAQVELTVQGRPLVLERRWEGARRAAQGLRGRPAAGVRGVLRLLPRGARHPARPGAAGNPHAPQAWPEPKLAHDAAPPVPRGGRLGESSRPSSPSPSSTPCCCSSSVRRVRSSPLPRPSWWRRSGARAELEAQAASFAEVLADVTRELLPGGVPARPALEAALAAVEAELAQLGTRREERAAALRAGGSGGRALGRRGMRRSSSGWAGQSSRHARGGTRSRRRARTPSSGVRRRSRAGSLRRSMRPPRARPATSTPRPASGAARLRRPPEAVHPPTVRPPTAVHPTTAMQPAEGHAAAGGHAATEGHAARRRRCSRRRPCSRRRRIRAAGRRASHARHGPRWRLHDPRRACRAGQAGDGGHHARGGGRRGPRSRGRRRARRGHAARGGGGLAPRGALPGLRAHRGARGGAPGAPARCACSRTRRHPPGTWGAPTRRRSRRALSAAEVAALEAELTRVRAEAGDARAALLGAEEEVARLEERLAPGAGGRGVAPAGGVRGRGAGGGPDAGAAAAAPACGAGGGPVRDPGGAAHRHPRGGPARGGGQPRAGGARAACAGRAAGGRHPRLPQRPGRTRPRALGRPRGVRLASRSSASCRWTASRGGANSAPTCAPTSSSRTTTPGYGCRAPRPSSPPGWSCSTSPPTSATSASPTRSATCWCRSWGCCSRPDMQGAQLIAAGRAFASLPGAHRVDLTRRWR